jgi:tetratricopeptide (TPR) repeat protein
MWSCFSAIIHGCAASRHQEVYSEVYVPRVQRGNERFIVRKLGALNADLAALASFFDDAWSTPAKGLSDNTKARVLNYAAFALRALGRLREAVEPFDAGLKADAAAGNWNNAASAAGSVSELRLALGDIAEAIATARTGVAHADESEDAFMRVVTRATLANDLHQGGQVHKAIVLFREAEAMQAATPGQLPKLYSVRGYQYCDLLLDQGHTQSVIERANYALKAYAAGQGWLLDIARDNLSLGCAYAASSQPREARALAGDVDAPNDPGSHRRPGRDDESGAGGLEDDAGRARKHLDAAVDGLRRAGQVWLFVPGLLSRAAFRRAMDEFHDTAVDLEEAYDIVARGEMRLHLTDYHLESARLMLAQIAFAPEAAEALCSLFAKQTQFS